MRARFWKVHYHNWILVGISNDPSIFVCRSFWVFQCDECREYKHETHQGHWAWKKAEEEPADIKELNRIYKLK